MIKKNEIIFHAVGFIVLYGYLAISHKVMIIENYLLEFSIASLAFITATFFTNKQRVLVKYLFVIWVLSINAWVLSISALGYMVNTFLVFTLIAGVHV